MSFSRTYQRISTEGIKGDSTPKYRLKFNEHKVILISHFLLDSSSLASAVTLLQTFCHKGISLFFFWIKPIGKYSHPTYQVKLE